MIIKITDDFDLAKMADCGQCFRAGCDDKGVWHFITGKSVLHISQAGDDEYDVDVSSEEWERVWHPYFDLDRNYRDIRKSIKKDQYLQEASAVGKGIRILRQDAWEMLITFIISQRKNIPAIRKSVELLSERYGGKKGKTSLFPEPGALLAAGEKGLSDCSLGYRLPYILDAAQKVYSGEMDLVAIEALGDEELFEKLKTVKGVGTKVSNCICLFGYGRTGRAPVDVWIQRVIDEQYGGEDPFPKYGDAAGIMQQYVFYQAQAKKVTSI